MLNPQLMRSACLLWQPPTMLPLRSELKAYELRVHVFQARNLPAKNADGLLDPYVKVSVAGTSAIGMTDGEPRTTLKHRTHDPLWYETLLLQTWLPPLELAPQAPAKQPCQTR